LLDKIKKSQKEKDELFKNVLVLEQEAIEAKEARTQFLAKTVHELRTPMTPIIVNTEMVIEDFDSLSKEDIYKALEAVL
jgi:signal transduction histidine kinase